MKSKMHLVIYVTGDKQVHEIIEDTISADRAVSAKFERVYISSKAELLEKIASADVLFSFAVPEAVIKTGTDLKWIHLASAGVERSLTPALLASKIKLTCSRGIHANTIAEYVIMAVLAFSKNLRQAYAYQGRHEWRFEKLIESRFDLEGKTICIIGLGSIGSRVAKLAKTFDMHVIGAANRARKIRNVDKVYPAGRLKECLAHADIVVLSAPLTDKTYHLIGRNELAVMKKNAFLVNIGRGKLVDEPALIAALKEKRIAGAALDVFQTEPLASDSPFWDMENVSVTPHYSGTADDLWGKIAALFCENAIRFISGKRMLGIVSKKKGY
jgi:phosphoglycerate dehydrogenase-like enzyme